MARGLRAEFSPQRLIRVDPERLDRQATGRMSKIPARLLEIGFIKLRPENRLPASLIECTGETVALAWSNGKELACRMLSRGTWTVEDSVTNKGMELAKTADAKLLRLGLGKQLDDAVFHSVHQLRVMLGQGEVASHREVTDAFVRDARLFIALSAMREELDEAGRRFHSHAKARIQAWESGRMVVNGFGELGGDKIVACSVMPTREGNGTGGPLSLASLYV